MVIQYMQGQHQSLREFWWGEFHKTKCIQPTELGLVPNWRDLYQLHAYIINYQKWFFITVSNKEHDICIWWTIYYHVSMQFKIKWHNTYHNYTTVANTLHIKAHINIGRSCISMLSKMYTFRRFTLVNQVLFKAQNE